MLAKFENGYFLEVEYDEEYNDYNFSVYDENMEYKTNGYTEYRSLEMFYPMNEIDYILNYCEPKYVEGKYELLEYETMDEYEDYLDDLEYGELDGGWILECQGTDNEDIRYYKTEKDAKRVMLKEAKEMADNVENSDFNDEYCEVSGDEYYQIWKIYRNKTFKTEKEKIYDEIEKEFDRINISISQYAYELQDTYVIRSHVNKLEKLVKQLKEME